MRVVRHIREDIKNTDGIELRPLDISDICMETAKKIIPKSLYLLIRQIICPSDQPDVSSATRNQLEDERKVLSVAQDVIHSPSNSKVKLPKHISLAMAIHHLSGSKLLITLLNRMGHCSSYDEVQAVDNSLAMEVTALVEQMGTIIPSNIIPGSFIQIAADNNDINEETLDGENTTHATTIVVYQREQYGPEPPSTSHADQTRRRRSLHSPGPLYEVQDCSMHGRRPVVKDFLGVVDREWFSGKSEDLTSATVDDTIWTILRIEPSLLLKTTVLEGANRQLVPSWSAFNAILYPDIPCSTNIGYCPLLDASSTEFSTVYTVMKHAQQISQRVGQLEDVITLDLAIYVKAKEIQFKFPAEFSNTILLLGSFHIAMNFLSIIGRSTRVPA